jgi:hypothetical protein
LAEKGQKAKKAKTFQRFSPFNFVLGRKRPKISDFLRLNLHFEEKRPKSGEWPPTPFRIPNKKLSFFWARFSGYRLR